MVAVGVKGVSYESLFNVVEDLLKENKFYI
jgi:hypothetical protein